jgi:hypothetical protein
MQLYFGQYKMKHVHMTKSSSHGFIDYSLLRHAILTIRGSNG